MPTPNQVKLKIETVRIEDIRTDGRTQFRVCLDEAALERYSEALDNGDVFAPIVAFRDEAGVLWLVDGFHRLEMFRRKDIEEAPADVRSGSQRDAKLFAVGVNNTHGLPRSNADKRMAVTELLTDEEWGQWSDRKIAQFCAVSNRFVSNVRDELKNPATPSEPASTVHGGQQEEPEVERSTVNRSQPEEPDAAPEASGSVISTIPEPSDEITDATTVEQPMPETTPTTATPVVETAAHKTPTPSKPTSGKPTLSAPEQVKLAWNKCNEVERQEIWAWIREQIQVA